MEMISTRLAEGNHIRKFRDEGFAIVEDVLSKSRVKKAQKLVSRFFLEGAGSRNILEDEWCRDLVIQIKGHPAIGKIVGPDSACVQCTLFKKSTGKNWLVPLHRDRFIPLMEKFERPGWQGWSTKEGSHFVEPPGTVLSQLVAVRIHLEENTLENGPLEVIPKSNKGEETNGSRLSLTVSAGGAILLSPLLLHASSKVKEGDRTVLHFLFGPRHLPKPAQWRWAI